ncbi:hypothetical protein [Massilia aerilata]|uniref:Phage tail protein n=1 Tax=Massilia aerilata TaxID=453817 RepID=A0ABW0S7B9_9BURK
MEDLTEPQPHEAARYVTYNEDGTLDGCYLQVPPEEHVDRMIVIDEELAPAWVNYRANEAREGIELAPAAVSIVDLDALKSEAISSTYSDVDAVTAAAVGNRVEEYRDAEVTARVFAAAGYEGEVDVVVSSYAQYNPTGEAQTNQWAADQIIARADAFRSAQKAMRAQRFASQAAMRAAETPGALAAAAEAWNDFIAGVRAALGV